MSAIVPILEIDLTDVQTEAQETGQTIKDLRAEVKELRSTFENTEIGTEEFGKALIDLTKKQQELTNVTKSGVAAQKGSYNDLVNQMALLKMQWRSTADEAERAQLGDQIYTINSRLKEMDSEIGNFQRNVGNYRMELKQLKEEMLSLEEGTEEYTAACARAAEISQKMQDVNEFVAASAQDMGDHLANATGVAAGMVGVFQTVQASLNLIGVESENVEKMIATMQNLMAITQGLTAVEGAIDKYKRLNETIKGLTIVQNLFGIAKTKTAAATAADTTATVANTTATVAQTGATTAATTATWSFNAALAANPLGAILVAVTAVVTALVSLTSWLGTAGDTAEEAAASNDKFTESLEDQNAAIEYNIQMLEAQGKTRLEAMRESLGDQKKLYEDAYNQYIKIFNNAKDSSRWFGLANPISDEEQEEINRAYDIYVAQVEKYNDRVRDINLEATREQTAARKKAEDDELKAQQDASRKRIQQAEEEAKRVKDLRENYNKAMTKLYDELYEFGLDDHSKERKQIIDGINEELRAQKAAYKEGAISYEEMNAFYVALRTKLNGKLQELELKHQHNEIQLVKESLDEKTKLYKDNRDRIIRTLVATEKSVELAFERTPVGATAKYKVEAEEYMLQRLKETYTEQLRLIEAQDAKERAAIQEQITILEQRQASIGLLQEEEKLLYQLREQYSLVGGEAIGLSEKLNDVTEKLVHIGIEKTIADMEGYKDAFNVLKETFSELNDIGGYFSDEWTNVFDSIITGIDTACTSLRDMDSVLKSNASETEKAAAKWKGYGQMAAAGLAVASNLMGALADEQDKTTEEGFERAKKFQIAQAVMSTLAGVASAWASAMQLGPIAGPIAGALLSAMMLTMGGLQIANIKKQKFDGGGGDLGGTNAIPSLSAVNAIGNPVQTTTTIEGASTESTATDTRVYVLESDITSAQNNVKTTVEEATF